MKRILACLRETWLLWLLFFGCCTAMTVLLDPVYVITFPICIFVFVYFTFMRYDETGKKIDS